MSARSPFLVLHAGLRARPECLAAVLRAEVVHRGPGLRRERTRRIDVRPAHRVPHQRHALAGRHLWRFRGYAPTKRPETKFQIPRTTSTARRILMSQPSIVYARPRLSRRSASWKVESATVEHPVRVAHPIQRVTRRATLGAIGRDLNHALPQGRRPLDVLKPERSDDPEAQQHSLIRRIDLERLLELGDRTLHLSSVVVADTEVDPNIDVVRTQLQHCFRTRESLARSDELRSTGRPTPTWTRHRRGRLLRPRRVQPHGSRRAPASGGRQPASACAPSVDRTRWWRRRRPLAPHDPPHKGNGTRESQRQHHPPLARS